MGVARLPAERNGSPQSLEPVEDRIAWWIAEGETPGDIARRLAPNSKALRKKIRRQIRTRIYRNPLLQVEIAKRVKYKALTHAGEVTEAVADRVRDTGRPDGAKLILEMSGVHAPRVEHEHSGDVSLTLNLPRPEGPKQVESESEVVDAEVVDD